MRRIAILILITALLAACSGCAATRAKLTLTRVHGEPVISVEVCNE